MLSLILIIWLIFIFIINSYLFSLKINPLSIYQSYLSPGDVLSGIPPTSIGTVCSLDQQHSYHLETLLSRYVKFPFTIITIITPFIRIHFTVLSPFFPGLLCTSFLVSYLASVELIFQELLRKVVSEVTFWEFTGQKNFFVILPSHFFAPLAGYRITVSKYFSFIIWRPHYIYLWSLVLLWGGF